MELDLKYEQLDCYACVLDTVVRREETQETIVSDSMPDIGTVVTVSATPLLRSSRASGGSVSCEGETAVTVLYEPEGGGAICAVPVRVPFRCETELAAAGEDSRLNVLLSLMGAEVKVMNPRKVLVQVEVSARFLAFSPYRLRYSVGAEDTDGSVQTKREQVSLQYVSQVTEKTFPFEESVGLSGGHRRIDRLLSCDVVPYCSEAKLVGSKVVFKGGVRARIRAQDSEGGLIGEDYELPVSQVLDAGGSGEEAAAMVSLSAVDLQAELIGGEEIRFQMELYACAVLMDRRETEVLIDAYSIRCPCQCSERTEELFRLVEQNTAIHPIRQAMDLDLPAAEVVDQVAAVGEIAGGERRCRLKVSVCLRERDGRLIRTDQSCHVELPIPPIQADRTVLEVKLLECTCISAAGGMEVRGSLLVRYAMLRSETLHYVGALTLDEEAQSDGPRPSAVLRMLREGETLWDLAKEHLCREEEIMEVDQSGDAGAAGGRLLLIPRNR